MLQYRTDPLGYLSHIVGYEGKGSLTSYLRDRVWALSLAAGNAEDGFENNEVELESKTFYLVRMLYLATSNLIF